MPTLFAHQRVPPKPRKPPHKRFSENSESPSATKRIRLEHAYSTSCDAAQRILVLERDSSSDGEYIESRKPTPGLVTIGHACCLLNMNMTYGIPWLDHGLGLP